MIEGELLIAEGKFDPGLDELHAALALEEALKYDEPPSWMIPLRHTIGANLMATGRFAEAEQVYREDLKASAREWLGSARVIPSARCAAKAGGRASVRRARFEKIWAKADVKITSSCLCRSGFTANCDLNRRPSSPLKTTD